jgi:regulator of protease activity HflC (stomatin/prohibitin superfamily)
MKITKPIVISASALVLLLAMFITWALFMHTETVEAGEEGVITDKPYFFGRDGVREQPLKDGRVLLFKTSSMSKVRMTPQAVDVNFDDLSSADNILLDFSSSIQYQFTDSVSLIKNFGAQNWFTANIERQYMAIVRDVVKRYTMTQMMSDSTTAAEVDADITKKLQALVVEAKMPLRIMNVSLGRAQPNANVLAQMNETAAQQQRKKTLVEAEAAEIQRKKEQMAKADADNAYRNSIGLSPEQFVRLEAIRRYSDACAKSERCIVTSGQADVLVGGK